MSDRESKYFRAPRWLFRLHQIVFLVGVLTFGVGIYFGFQTSSRGDLSSSASRPHRANPGKGTTVYYLSRADYFLCEQLWLVGFLTTLAPCVTFCVYGRWLARHSPAHENNA